MSLPVLETQRLIIRPFVMDDLDDIHRILDIELGEANFGTEGAKGFEERKPGWIDSDWTPMSESSKFHANTRALERIAATNEALASEYP
jgi:hypothetical protein